MQDQREVLESQALEQPSIDDAGTEERHPSSLALQVRELRIHARGVEERVWQRPGRRPMLRG